LIEKFRSISTQAVLHVSLTHSFYYLQSNSDFDLHGLIILGVTQSEFLHLKNEPQRAQSSRKDRKVLKYIFAKLCGKLCALCGKIKNEFQLRNS